jgi:hypothetical protein
MPGISKMGRGVERLHLNMARGLLHGLKVQPFVKLIPVKVGVEILFNFFVLR